MKRIKYVYWQDGDTWLGYLEEYPDYQTQGESREELKENLKSFERRKQIPKLCRYCSGKSLI